MGESWACLCVDSIMPSTIKGNNCVSYFYRNVGKRRQLQQQQQRMVHLSNSFLDPWPAKMVSICTSSTKRHKLQRLIVVDELGGQYEDTFNDVKMELVEFFTFKAVRTVLEQLYEMNPPQYKWFNNFVADNVPSKGNRFLQTLVKERRELAERVMITRLTLYGRWIKAPG
ncbi:chaperonin-like RbcX protein 2, chloroplastic isoform X2 [Salvia miltiorrhiza]|uniref:chaperonin-like RbcX protein 2, chloroplastic isoform X2 n=1 Tax=Salvia miltiorrhiza TaxID=226208 RepID=UPI0025ABD563|nr:chaperonin-like RbcX protein 2, chloroplastic isoform X2 [Salvia miltiorrhiza]